MDSFYSHARCAQAAQSTEKVDSVWQKSTESALWSDEARHLPTPRLASLSFILSYPQGSFLFPFKTSQIQVIFKVLQADTAIQQFLFLYLRYFRSSTSRTSPLQFLSADLTISLFLVLDFRYNIPPPNPCTLRGAYGYLPDCANLFERCAPSTCVVKMPANLAGGVHRDKRANQDIRSLQLV